MPLNVALLVTSLVIATPNHTARLPDPILRQLPSGYVVLTHAVIKPTPRAHRFYVVALRSKKEAVIFKGSKAPPRPLLIFEFAANGRFIPAGRNDEIIARFDDGGQCDPFEDGVIATRGDTITVENAVACGPQHWTDSVTFRFDSGSNGFLFDHERIESWAPNPVTDANAEALISDGPRVRRPTKNETVRFNDFRRKIF